MHVNQEGSKKHASKPTTWEYFIAKRYFSLFHHLPANNEEDYSHADPSQCKAQHIERLMHEEKCLSEPWKSIQREREMHRDRTITG